MNEFIVNGSSNFFVDESKHAYNGEKSYYEAIQLIYKILPGEREKVVTFGNS